MKRLGAVRRQTADGIAVYKNVSRRSARPGCAQNGAVSFLAGFVPCPIPLMTIMIGASTLEEADPGGHEKIQERSICHQKVRSRELLLGIITGPRYDLEFPFLRVQFNAAEFRAAIFKRHIAKIVLVAEFFLNAIVGVPQLYFIGRFRTCGRQFSLARALSADFPLEPARLTIPPRPLYMLGS